MRVKKETIQLARIRRLILEAIRWYLVDKGMPHFYNSENYRYSKRIPFSQEKKQGDVYYTKSKMAIENIAKKIYCVIKK